MICCPGFESKHQTLDELESLRVHQCRKRQSMKFFLCVIGMVMVVEGLPYFAFPVKMKLVIRKVLEMSDKALQKYGFVLMLFGLFLVYLGRR